MFKKGTKLYSIFGSKCPKCHGESMYKNPNPFNIARVYDMPERCSKCGTKYKIEPSFFYGAMYVSYALTVAMAVAIFVIGYLLHLGLMTSFIAIFVLLIAFNPLIMRISRLLYINMFVHFNKRST